MSRVMTKRIPLHPHVKEALGYKPENADAEVLADWRKRVRDVCKPCWELKYCPYGPLVEEFPLPPVTRQQAEEHAEYLRSTLATGRLGDGSKLDAKRRRWFRQELQSLAKTDFPEVLPEVLRDVACRVFGHICPVFFVSEPLTETVDRRKHGRSIPRDVMLKVVRRDGQICQRCHKPVPDNQVEFDHIIPFSRGGASTTDNLRLIHRDCNREKSDSLGELLAPYPIVHLFELQEKAKRKRRRTKSK